MNLHGKILKAGVGNSNNRDIQAEYKMSKKIPPTKSKTWVTVVGVVLLTFIGYCVVSPAEKVEWTGFRKSSETSKTVKITAPGKEETATTREISGRTLWD